MARDRQRSKARQRRRAQQQQGAGESRARDARIDDPQVDEQGLTDDAPAPDPLKNASPDADQARAATTGADRPGPAEEIDVSDDPVDDDFDRAPDEVELPPDLAGGRGGRGGGAGLQTLEDEVPDRPRKDRGKVATFLRGCVDELRRVQWPDRKQVGQATAVVLGFVAIAGLFLGAVDALFQPLIEAIL